MHELYAGLCESSFCDLPPVDGRLRLLESLIGTGITEALWLLRLLHRSLSVEGDVCEFGVAEGTTSALLANEIRSSTKDLWLFDSFQGLPRPSDKDELINDIFRLGSIELYQGKMRQPVERVRERLEAIAFPSSRVHVVPGFIEQTITSSPLPQQVSFAYVDFDFYQPTLVALHFLAEHLSVHGSVVVDDYGFFSSGVQAAVDELLAEQETLFAAQWPPPWAGHFIVLTKTRGFGEECSDMAAEGTSGRSYLGLEQKPRSWPEPALGSR